MSLFSNLSKAAQVLMPTGTSNLLGVRHDIDTNKAEIKFFKFPP